MYKKQSYSHGLLYSVAPSNFSSLHLHDVDGKDSVDWQAYKFQYEGDTFVETVFHFLKTTAENWGIVELH